MKKFFGVGLFAGIALVAVVSACHTYIFQPVKKQIQGKWLLSESDSSKVEIWDFSGDCLTITVNDTTMRFIDPGSGDTVECIKYKVENKFTKHYLYTDAYWGISDPDELGRWLIVKVNKKVLYLSSEHYKKTKGSFQRGFTRK